MNFKDLKVGQEYGVETSPGWTRVAKIIEVGTFTKKVYSGDRDFRGHTASVKGARVVYRRHDGTYSETRTERTSKTVKVPGPFGGYREERIEGEITVDNTEWVASRCFVYTAEALTAKAQNEKAVAERKARLKEQMDNLHPCVTEVLANAGVSSYRASQYHLGGKVELSYAEFMKIVDHLDQDGDRRQAKQEEAS